VERGGAVTAGVITQGAVNYNCFGGYEHQVTLHIFAFIMVKLGYKDIPLLHTTVDAQGLAFANALDRWF
jgi:hypothetical protein